MLKLGIGNRVDDWKIARGWATLWHLRVWICLFAILGASIGVFYASNSPKSYTVITTFSSEALKLKPNDADWFQSPSTIASVVDDLILFNDLEFNGVMGTHNISHALRERLFPTSKNMTPDHRREIAIKTLKAQSQVYFDAINNTIKANITTHSLAKSEKIAQYFTDSFLSQVVSVNPPLDKVETGTLLNHSSNGDLSRTSDNKIPTAQSENSLTVDATKKSIGLSMLTIALLFGLALAMAAALVAVILGGFNLYTKKVVSSALNLDGINQSETIMRSSEANQQTAVLPVLVAEPEVETANDNEGETPEKDDLEMYSNPNYPWQGMVQPQPMDNGHAMGQPATPHHYPYYPQQAQQPYQPQGHAPHTMAGYSQPMRQPLPQPAPQMMPQQQFYAPQPPMQQYHAPMQGYMMPQPAPQMMMPPMPQPYYAPQPPMPFMQQVPQQMPMMASPAPQQMAPNMVPSMAMEEFDELLNEGDEQFDAERYQALRTRIRRLRSALRDAA